MIDLKDYEVRVLQKSTGDLIEGKEAELLAKYLFINELEFSIGIKLDEMQWARISDEDPKMAKIIKNHVLHKD